MATKHSFKKHINQYSRSIQAIGNLLGPLMTVLKISLDSKAEKKTEIIDAHGTLISSDESGGTYSIDHGYEEEVRIIDWFLEDFGTTSQLLPPTFLVTAVSQYDAYLGNLIRDILAIQPEILSQSDKKYSYADVLEYGNLEEFQEHIVESVVEGVLRKSHADQFRWLESALGITLTKNLACWSSFIELTQRRHLFVHTAGRVSAQYLEVCKEHGVIIEDGTRRNTRLGVNKDYFTKCINTLHEIGIKLGQVVWRKLLPDEENQADSVVIDVTFNAMCRGHYELSAELLRLVLDVVPRVNSNTEACMAMRINMAQCKKWLGDDPACQSIIRQMNPQLLSGKFALAVHVLRDEFESAANSMRVVGDSDKTLGRSAYRLWPLFKEFRKTNEFKSAYLDVFGSEYVETVKDVESDSDEAMSD